MNNQNSINDEIDLNFLFKSISHNKRFIILTTLIISFFSIIYTKLKDPIYEGTFQMLVKSKDNSKSFIQSEVIGLRGFGLGKSNNKNQEIIFKSSSVLNPVFDFVKNKYKSRNENISKLNFKKWVNKNLDIKFIEKTDVLKVNFRDKDKKLILETLYLISNEFNTYSQLIRNEEINNSIKYLESQQKIIKSKASSKLKELNEFSIKNGLGDIDGFVSLGEGKTEIFSSSNPFDIESNEPIENVDSIFSERGINETNQAGQRFKRQFANLEKYESQYTELSSKLKTNSKYMKELERKIINLRLALKRPNEILVKYRELNKQSKRYDLILENIEKELAFNKLESARKTNSWNLISSPVIKDGRVSPILRYNLASAFLISLFLSSIFFVLKDKKSGSIYLLEQLKENIQSNFLTSININNKEFTHLAIKNILEKDPVNKKNISLEGKPIGIFTKNSDLIQILSSGSEYNFLFSNFDKSKDAEKCHRILFFIGLNDGDLDDLVLLNEYLRLYSEKVIGWVFINEET